MVCVSTHVLPSRTEDLKGLAVGGPLVCAFLREVPFAMWATQCHGKSRISCRYGRYSWKSAGSAGMRLAMRQNLLPSGSARASFQTGPRKSVALP